MCRYPKKEFGTYWECEDYPKAWGHGTDKNPLFKSMVNGSQEPMRDRTVFKSSTTLPTDYKPLSPVPNRSLQLTFILKQLYAIHWTGKLDYWTHSKIEV